MPTDSILVLLSVHTHSSVISVGNHLSVSTTDMLYCWCLHLYVSPTYAMNSIPKCLLLNIFTSTLSWRLKPNRTHRLPHSSESQLHPSRCSGPNPSRPFSISKSYWLYLQILLFPDSDHLLPSTCVHPCIAPTRWTEGFCKNASLISFIFCSKSFPSCLE